MQREFPRPHNHVPTKDKKEIIHLREEGNPHSAKRSAAPRMRDEKRSVSLYVNAPAFEELLQSQICTQRRRKDEQVISNKNLSVVHIYGFPWLSVCFLCRTGHANLQRAVEIPTLKSCDRSSSPGLNQTCSRSFT